MGSFSGCVQGRSENEPTGFVGRAGVRQRVKQKHSFEGLFRRPSMPRQFVALTISNVMGAVASFVGVAFLAHSVRVGEFGRVVFAQAAVSSIFIVLDPRFDDAIVHLVPVVERDQGPSSVTHLFRTVLSLDALLGLLFSGLGIALLWAHVFPLGPAGDREFLMLAVLHSGLQAAMGTASSAFSVTHGLTQLGLLRAGMAVVSTGIAVLGLLWGGAVWYMAMLAAAAGTTTGVLSILALRRMHRRYGSPSAPLKSRIRGFGRFSLIASLASSVSVGTEALPLAIIGAVGGPGTLGGFRVGLAPAKLTTTAFSPLPTILFPILSKESARGEWEAIRARVLRWTRVTVPIALGLAAIAWFTLPLLIPVLFGSKFDFAVQPARFLVAAALVRGTTAWSKVLPLAVGQPGMSLLIRSLDAALLVAVTWWLASTGGAVGIALGQLIVAILLSLVWIRFATGLDGSPRPSSQVSAESA